MGMQDVEPAEAVMGIVDRPFQRGVLGNVKTHGLGPPACRCDLFRDSARAAGIEVGDDDRRPVPGKGQRPGPANAGPCPGQECDAVFQQHGPYSSGALTPPRRRMVWARISTISDTARTMVPMALISGVTPRRMEEKT